MARIVVSCSSQTKMTPASYWFRCCAVVLLLLSNSVMTIDAVRLAISKTAAEVEMFWKNATKPYMNSTVVKIANTTLYPFPGPVRVGGCEYEPSRAVQLGSSWLEPYDNKLNYCSINQAFFGKGKRVELCSW
jgi:hypothetical protein